MFRSKSYALVLALASLGQVTPALADYGNPPSWTSCQTTSQGRTFRDADYGLDNARARTVNGCTANPSTNNGECRYNANCDGDYAGSYARCTTQSRGRTFLDGSTDVNVARNSVLNSCTANPSTSNDECRYNVRCEGGNYYPPQPPHYPPAPQPQPPYEDPNRQFVCSTESNGRNFSVPGRGREQTRHKVIMVCRQNPYTDRIACARNSRCQ